LVLEAVSASRSAEANAIETWSGEIGRTATATFCDCGSCTSIYFWI
jgi:hypothetical protein